MLQKLSSTQLSEWEAYNRIDPVGTFRDDLRIADLMALIYNLFSQIFAKSGQDVKLKTALDFIYQWDKEERKEVRKQQTIEEQKQILLSIAKAQNRKFERQQKIDTTKPPISKHKK